MRRREKKDVPVTKAKVVPLLVQRQLGLKLTCLHRSVRGLVSSVVERRLAIASRQQTRHCREGSCSGKPRMKK